MGATTYLQGEAAAVLNAVSALTYCLGAPDGCQVVPGLPEDQFYFTTLMAGVGGLILGFVSRLEPQGFVQRQWVWPIVFSPLWAPIFVNFSLGPVLQRTADPTPVAINTAAFLGAAALPLLANLFVKPALNTEATIDDDQ